MAFYTESFCSPLGFVECGLVFDLDPCSLGGLAFDSGFMFVLGPCSLGKLAFCCVCQWRMTVTSTVIANNIFASFMDLHERFRSKLPSANDWGCWWPGPRFRDGRCTTLPGSCSCFEETEGVHLRPAYCILHTAYCILHPASYTLLAAYCILVSSVGA